MVTATFFAHNRSELLKRLQNGALIVMSGYGEMQRGNDAAFDFEQEASFWYISGINAPDWWIIIDGAAHKTWLVRPDLTHAQAIFDGSVGDTDAQAISGADGVLTRTEAEQKLRDLSRSHALVYSCDQPKMVREYCQFQLNSAQGELKRYLERTFKKVEDSYDTIAKLRTIKQPEEIAAIRHAIKQTVKAFERVRTELPRLKHEYEVEAIYNYEFRFHGGQGHAYSPIVAGGHHACTLHYGDNHDTLTKKQLLLLDIGARVVGYAADISRTYAYGQISKRQQAVHTAVCIAQAACINLIKPGLPFREYYQDVNRIMKDALIDLKLSTDRIDEYFPHAIGHGLGIDVHDPLHGYETMQPGMIMTVEPGIYIAEEGIGVRIEDDILVTDKGHENLSRALGTDF